MPVLLALLAGAMLPVQAAVNARLGRSLGGAVWAATVSGAVLTVALGVAALVTARGLPRTEGAGSVPWWGWVGGLCGALTLAATTAIAPRLGAATMIALLVTGQLLCALALDQFGLLGLATHAITLRRALAGGLILSGALLIK